MSSHFAIADNLFIDKLPIGIYRNTPGVGGRFLSVNEAMVSILGYDSAEELLNTDVSMLYVRPAERSSFVLELMQKNRIEQKRLHLRRKDGKTFYARVTAHTVYDDDGNIRYFDGALVPDFTEPESVPWEAEREQLATSRNSLQQEITRLEEENKTLQTHLADLHRQATASILAGGLAHEINNLNTTVLGLSQFIMSDETLRPDIQENLRRIADVVLRERALTRNMLHYIRPNPQETLSGNLTNCVESTLDLLSHEFKRNETVVLADLAPVADTRIDDHEVGQIVFNLLLNALHAVSECAEKSIRVRTWEDEELVCVSIRDTGCGVNPEHLDRIFNPMFSTRHAHPQNSTEPDTAQNEGGTGLGLSVSQILAKRYGGCIRVEPLTGNGSEFILELPRALAEPAHHPARSSERCPHIPDSADHAPQTTVDEPEEKTEYSRTPQEVSIFVVDDEPDSCEMIRQALSRHEYPVQTCSDPTLALDRIKECAFDILICDMQMPKLCGKDFLQSVTNQGKLPRIIVITGECPDSVLQRLEGIPHEALLRKPFSLKELYSEINKIRETLD